MTKNIIDAEHFNARVREAMGMAMDDLPMEYQEAVQAILAMLKTEPSVYVPRWIPVAERRPEAYGRYLVTLEYEGYRSVMPLYYGRINRIDTFYDSDSEYGDIEYCGAIAWMPLPEPYKGGEVE